MILCAEPRSQFLAHQQEIEAAILRVVRGSFYILGEEVKALEKEFAEYIGCDFAIGVANGTDALELALRAYDISSGDEVITVSHTAVATVAAIEAVGATPVLVDIEEDYYTICVSQIEQMVNRNTKAIIAVHLYGQSAELDAIADICHDHNLILIEDVSQAHGATYKGRRLGSIGQVGCFSCYPTKNLGAIGDAGLITTSDAEVAKKIRLLREYGWERRNISDLPGRNSRLDEIQAAILRVKLKYLDLSNDKRRKIASFYDDALKEFLTIPKCRMTGNHVYHIYAVRTNSRDQVLKTLKDKNVNCGIHYPFPIHLQPAYKNRVSTHPSMEVSCSVAETIMSLPIYPDFAHEEIVAKELLKLFK